MSALFIPSKIKVGFQERKGTFTGKLAYVIYYDEKGKLRKEGSWESWRDKNMEPVEFDNTPQTGFIFNKGIQRSSEWFGTGRSVVRLYDSRDFEFEISIDNVINILMHSDVSKRDIVEPCVFAWDGTNLVLLPVNSVEYQESVEYTEKQGQKLSAKELVKGRRYYVKKSKKNEIVTYIGFFETWGYDYYCNYRKKDDDGSVGNISKGKKHIFYDGAYFVEMGAPRLSGAVSDDIVEDYAFLVDKWHQNIMSSPIASLSIEPITDFVESVDYYKRAQFPEMHRLTNGSIEHVRISAMYNATDDKLTMSLNGSDAYITTHPYQIIDGVGMRRSYDVRPRRYYSYRNGNGNNWSYGGSVSERIDMNPLFGKLSKHVGGLDARFTPTQYVEYMTSCGYGRLMATLQNGSTFKLSNY